MKGFVNLLEIENGRQFKYDPSNHCNFLNLCSTGISVDMPKCRQISSILISCVSSLGLHPDS